MMNNEFNNPIGSYTPLPNLDISNHHIEPRGLFGFWCKFTYITLLLILIGGSVSAIIGGVYCLEECEWEWSNIIGYHKHRCIEYFEEYIEYFNEECFEFLGCGLGLIGLIAISFWGFKIHRRILLARTERLLKMFSQGSWILALNTKNVYLRDSFVLYYLGVCNLYVRQNYDVRQNYVTAEKLFAESVDRGVPEALIGLGWMAENGWGKPQNKELAQKLYAEAKEKIENRRESNGKGDVRGVSQKKIYMRSEVLWGVAMLSALALLSLFVNYWISRNFQFLYLYYNIK